MSPTIMHFHDNYSLPYCPVTHPNPGISHTNHLYYNIPQAVNPLPYSQWCVPSTPYFYPCIATPSMEYPNSRPKRLPDVCGTSSKKLKFSIDSILGRTEENDVNSTPEIKYENRPDENIDPACQQYYPATSTQSSQHCDSSSPKPSCTSESGCSSPERAGRQKRVRTIFTPEQLQRLEDEFSRQQYLVGEERLHLAHSLGLTEAQVKVWFQNRRIKFRREAAETEQKKLLQLRSSESRNDDDQICQQMSPPSPSSSEEAESKYSPEESSNGD